MHEPHAPLGKCKKNGPKQFFFTQIKVNGYKNKWGQGRLFFYPNVTLWGHFFALAPLVIQEIYNICIILVG